MKIIFAGSGSNLTKYSCHTHECFEIIAVTDGSADYIIEEKAYRASAGDIICIPPHTAHNIDNGNGYSDTYIQASECDVTGDILCFSDVGGEIQTLIKMLYTVFVQKDEDYEAIADGILNVISRYVLRKTEKKSKYDFVDKLKNVLAKKLSDKDIDISSEIGEIGISGDYMRHCFKASVGLTPNEYLTNLRIVQAKNYLSRSENYTIGEIADLCGFSDPYYFSRCFKAHVGIPPRNYRKMHRI